MKQLKLAFVILVSTLCAAMFPMFASAATGANATSSLEVAGFVIAARGGVTATNESGETRKLRRRSRFYSNEVIKTTDRSRAQLRFKDRALMTLRANSELDIGEYHFGGAKDPQNKAILKLVSGGFRTISGAIGKANKSAYRVSTPAASIGIRGTDYEVVISLDGKVFAAVWDGGITLTNDLGDLDLGSDSNYLFAEVKTGEMPSGLEEMPKVFAVSSGEKTELTPAQKKVLKSKLKKNEGKVKQAISKAAAFIKKHGKPRNSDVRESVVDQAVDGEIAAGRADFRLSASEEALLKDKGKFAVMLDAQDFKKKARIGRVAEFPVGQGDGDIFVEKSTGNVVLFKVSELGTQNASGSSHVGWGKWDKAKLFTDRNGRDAFSTLGKGIGYTAVHLDEAALRARSDTYDVNLMASHVTTTSDQFSPATAHSSSKATLNFADGTIAGSFKFNLALASNASKNVDLKFLFNGSMFNESGGLNHNFTGTIEDVAAPTKKVAADVTGVIIPGEGPDNSGNPGFAGSANASLDVDVDSTTFNIGIQSLFTYAELTEAEKPVFIGPPPF